MGLEQLVSSPSAMVSGKKRWPAGIGHTRWACGRAGGQSTGQRVAAWVLGGGAWGRLGMPQPALLSLGHPRPGSSVRCHPPSHLEHGSVEVGVLLQLLAAHARRVQQLLVDGEQADRARGVANVEGGLVVVCGQRRRRGGHGQRVHRPARGARRRGDGRDQSVGGGHSRARHSCEMLLQRRATAGACCRPPQGQQRPALLTCRTRWQSWAARR